MYCLKGKQKIIKNNSKKIIINLLLTICFFANEIKYPQINKIIISNLKNSWPKIKYGIINNIA